MKPLPELTTDELARYEWQLTVRDFGLEGQRRLKAATVLVSRVGGVGGSAALQLAAAGVGRLILAHAGNARLDDLNRQLLMTTESIGLPRVETAARRLRELNPHVEIETVGENISEVNAADLVSRCDVVVSAAPQFAERLLMNREAVRQRKPLVDCSMYDLEARLLTVLPGQTPCLACLYPEPPPNWKRQFPVISAVSCTVGSLAAMEVIKLVAGFGEPLAGRLLLGDLRDMSFRTLPIARREDCAACGAHKSFAPKI
ncbi:MAG TPA: HesA/MoeB/ThiF family protein [Pirellulales bacterium]|nr:HesA/MoeB/ThiF family protein [Pirellulales bacterium]